jgi:hypothetical protein
VKKNLHQVGYLQGLYGDARSTENKKLPVILIEDKKFQALDKVLKATFSIGLTLLDCRYP